MPGANTLGCKQFLAPALAGRTPPAEIIERIALSRVCARVGCVPTAGTIRKPRWPSPGER